MIRFGPIWFSFPCFGFGFSFFFDLAFNELVRLGIVPPFDFRFATTPLIWTKLGPGKRLNHLCNFRIDIDDFKT